VLAAVKAGLRGEIKQLDEWREVVKVEITTMRCWEDESPDMKKGREILRYCMHSWMSQVIELVLLKTGNEVSA
jgi:hypothetical protein